MMYRTTLTVFMLGIVLAVSTPVAAKTFKIATISPDGLSWMKRLREGVEEIEERTEGRVKFKIYPGGVQGDDYTVLRKMRIGQLHGGVVAASALTRFYPDLQVYNLPLIFRETDEVDYVRNRMDDRIIDGLEDGGIVSFSLIETGFAYILTVKPIEHLDDLKKVKAWVPEGDPIAARLVQSFDISPIPLNLTDVLAGLQTGLVDAVAVPPIVALALQWHNQVNYVVDLPLMYIYSMMMLDGKAFNSISESDRKVVTEVMNDLFEEIDRQNRADNREAFQALLNQGIELIEPDPAEVDAWRKQATTAIQELVDSDQISGESLLLLQQYLAEVRSGGEPGQSPSGE